MKEFMVALVLLGASLSAFADTGVYDAITKISAFKKHYAITKTPTGIDIKSKKTFKNSKGVIEPITHLELEGPIKNTGATTVNDGMNILVRIIMHEIDKTYRVKNLLTPGLRVNTIKVGGTEVGLFDYRMKHEPNTYVKRAVLLGKKGVYSFSLIMHQSKPDSKTGSILMAVVSAAVKSGKL